MMPRPRSNRGASLGSPALLTLMGLLLASSGCRGDDRRNTQGKTPPNEYAPVDTVTKWKPPAYWATYRTVFVRAVCDSLGNIKQAELLYSFASQAETDSILQLVRSIHLDPATQDGWFLTPRGPEVGQGGDKPFILPFFPPGPASARGSLPVTRGELKNAGLEPWLSMCDEVLQGWPLETWPGRGGGTMYEYPSPQHEVEDANLMALEMVSISPDATWRVHPFYDVGFDSQGRLSGKEVDTGFVLYRPGPHGGRQYVAGTTTGYASAEWIDSKRFVLSGYSEVVLDYDKGYARYHTPFLQIGNVDSLTFRSISGPPIPVQNMPVFYQRLHDYLAARYPKYWKMH